MLIVPVGTLGSGAAFGRATGDIVGALGVGASSTAKNWVALGLIAALGFAAAVPTANASAR